MNSLRRAPLALALLAAGCSGGAGERPSAGKPAPAEVWFEEVAQQSGLQFQHMRGLKQRFWYPEIVGAGLCWLDYDGDGHPDLYAVQSGDLEPGAQALPTCKLFHNLGNGQFEDVTARAGVAGHGYGIGCTVGDYDGDGRVDLYVTCYGPNILYHNNGDGTFSDVTRHGRGRRGPCGLGHELRLRRHRRRRRPRPVRRGLHPLAQGDRCALPVALRRARLLRAEQLPRALAVRALHQRRERTLPRRQRAGRPLHGLRQRPGPGAGGLRRRRANRRLRLQRRHAEPALDQPRRRQARRRGAAARLRGQPQRREPGQHGHGRGRLRPGRRSGPVHHQPARRIDHALRQRRQGQHARRQHAHRHGAPQPAPHRVGRRRLRLRPRRRARPVRGQRARGVLEAVLFGDRAVRRAQAALPRDRRPALRGSSARRSRGRPLRHEPWSGLRRLRRRRRHRRGGQREQWAAAPAAQHRAAPRALDRARPAQSRRRARAAGARQPAGRDAHDRPRCARLLELRLGRRPARAHRPLRACAGPTARARASARWRSTGSTFCARAPASRCARLGPANRRQEARCSLKPSNRESSSPASAAPTRRVRLHSRRAPSGSRSAWSCPGPEAGR